MSLNATPTAAPAAASRPVKEHACLECGNPYTPKKTGGQFCKTACRQAWNNRRMQRGAELYDLFMVHRYQRDIALKEGVMTLLNRMAMEFKEQDNRQRSGRRSWRKFADVIEERPFLRAQASYDGTGRGRS